MSSQGLYDGQDMVYLLIFSLHEVFFRKAVVHVEGNQPAHLGAVQAALPSPGACRNRETAENSEEQTWPELRGDGKNIWRNK